MRITLGANIAAIGTQRRLGESTRGLERSLERLSSGLRINRASDDAAGLMVAENLRTNVRVFSQSIRNLNDGISALNIASEATQNLSGVVSRLKELATQAANGALSQTQRSAVAREASSLQNEFNRIVAETKFNGIKLIDDETGIIRFQAGSGRASESISIDSLSLGAGARNDGTWQQGQLLEGNGIGTVGDFNSDGISDYIGSSAGNLVLQLGNGDGSFRAAVSLFTPSGGVGRSLDFNGDGQLDLISGSILLIGNGNGTFRAAVTLEPLNGGSVGDFNGDGIQDVVDETGVYLGDRSGNLTLRSTFSGFSFNFFSGQGYDVNGDGTLDVHVQDGAADSGLFLLGNGDGTFRLTATQTLTYSGTVSHAGDANGDGRIDLFMVDGDGGVFTLLGNGNGYFSLPVRFTDAAVAGAMTVGDIDNDGVLDILLNDNNEAKFEVYFGNGDGSFRAPNELAGFGYLASGIWDLNRDLVYDMVVQDIGADRMRVLLGRGGTGSVMNPIRMSTRSEALGTLAQLDTIQNNLSLANSRFGAVERRLGVAVSTLENSRVNLSEAEGRIRDVDVAAESAALVRSRILQSVGTAVLAQSQLIPRLALDLLRG